MIQYKSLIYFTKCADHPSWPKVFVIAYVLFLKKVKLERYCNLLKLWFMKNTESSLFLLIILTGASLTWNDFLGFNLFSSLNVQPKDAYLKLKTRLFNLNKFPLMIGWFSHFEIATSTWSKNPSFVFQKSVIS